MNYEIDDQTRLKLGLLKFMERVLESGSVFTVQQGKDFVIFSNGVNEVVPFWSSRYRVERVQQFHEKYRAYTCSELSLPEFLQKALPTLDQEGAQIGIDWAEEDLNGGVLSVQELLESFQSFQEPMVWDTPGDIGPGADDHDDFDDEEEK